MHIGPQGLWRRLAYSIYKEEKDGKDWFIIVTLIALILSVFLGIAVVRMAARIL